MLAQATAGQIVPWKSRMIQAASARKMASCQNLILFAVGALESLVLPLVGEAVEGDFLIVRDLFSLRHRSCSNWLRAGLLVRQIVSPPVFESVPVFDQAIGPLSRQNLVH